MLWIVFSLALASCGSREQAGREEPAAAPATSSDPERQELASLLPGDNAVAGWSAADQPRFFGPGDLWEYINGAADGYLAYGFRQVVTAEYSHAETQSQAVIDIYRMQDPRNAFGIYTQELNPDSDFRPIGAEGYLGGTALNFWSGPHYVKLTVFQESEELKAELLKIAEHISGKIGDPGSPPPEAQYFTGADLVPHSVRYVPRDILGQSYLSEGFEARFKRPEGESKVVVVSLPDSDAAREALSRYRNFISSTGKVERELTSPADGGISGRDGFYGVMSAVRQGNRLLISLGEATPDAALARIGAVLGNIG